MSKASIQAVSVNELFAETVQNVLDGSKQARFNGAVDVEVSLNSVSVDQKGALRIFSGNDTHRTSVSVRLATRIHVEDS